MPKATLHSGGHPDSIGMSQPEQWKFESNIKRDKLVKQTLKKQGWNVKEVWECELKPKKMERALERLLPGLLNKNPGNY